MAGSVCACCGAPDNGEDVICKFCQRPISPQLQASAIPCPQCKTLCRWGRQQCPQCQAWIVVSCVFCGALSPHTAPACLTCREPFAGAMQRKAQRESQRETDELLGALGSAAIIAGAVGGHRRGFPF